MPNIHSNETKTLIAASKVRGARVYDKNGELLGHIEEVMLNKKTGKAAYAIMSFGGIFGLGIRYHPLPWAALSYDTARDGYVLDFSRDRLDKAPSYGLDESDYLTDEEVERKIHEHYDVPPYWL